METKKYNIPEIKISYVNEIPYKDRIKINDSKLSYDILRESWEDMELVESFKILLLNRANHVLGVKVVSIGGTSGTVADPKVIFQSALKANASAIIISHNHPSGNLSPSSSDIMLTKRIVDGGKLLDISVLDHIILTTDSYFSFADELML